MSDECIHAEGQVAKGGSGRGLADMLPSYILAATGVIFATGFLVILAFLDRFGIREAGADFWKARYIHIGILCLAFPLILNGTILSLKHLIFHGKFNVSCMWQRLLPVGLLVINLEIACFIMVTLTNRSGPTGSIAGWTPMRLILITTIAGLAFILALERIVEKITGRKPESDADLSSASQTLSVSLRWILMLVVVGLDVWLMLDFRDVVTGCSPLLVTTYIVFSMILGLMISTIMAYEKRQEMHEGRKRAIAVLAASIIGPFFYLVILSFSYGVYQNIPSTRGGGDYTAAPKVVVTFKSAQIATHDDAHYFEPIERKTTIPLVVIEETGWAYFLADPNEAGGPAEWKQIGGRKPQILIVNKSEVTKIHSESRNPGRKPT